MVTVVHLVIGGDGEDNVGGGVTTGPMMVPDQLVVMVGGSRMAVTR